MFKNLSKFDLVSAQTLSKTVGGTNWLKAIGKAAWYELSHPLPDYELLHKH